MGTSFGASIAVLAKKPYPLIQKMVLISPVLSYSQKNYDDFGLLFKPFLEIIIENQEIFKVYPQATDDLDKSLNNSNRLILS